MPANNNVAVLNLFTITLGTEAFGSTYSSDLATGFGAGFVCGLCIGGFASTFASTFGSCFGASCGIGVPQEVQNLRPVTSALHFGQVVMVITLIPES